MSFYSFDYSNWDTTKENIGVGSVIVTLSIPQENEPMDKLFEEWETLFNKAKDEKIRYSLIIDGRGVTSLDFTLIKAIANWIGERTDLAEEYINKTAIIINNETVASIVNMALGTLYKPVRPCKTFGGGDLTGGITWAIKI